MRVMYCYLTADTEGSKVHIDSFMKAFVSLGEEVVDAGLITKPFTGNKAEWSIAKRIWAKLLWLRLNFLILFRTSRLASHSKADLLLFRFMPNHQLVFAIVVLSFFYPIVLELNAIRSIEDPIRANWLNNLLDRLTMRRVKSCFVVSQMMKEHVMGRLHLDEDKVAVIMNGVDVEVFEPGLDSAWLRDALRLENRFIAGFVGSFKPWHGVENIIMVAEMVQPECPDIAFLVVGDGKERGAYEAQVTAKGLAGNFVFTGFVPHEQVRDYLAVMDVALAPHKSNSFEETGGFHGSPLKIFEYMAMSKAIIATPIGQIKELIVDGESGRLIYAEDTMELKKELLRLYKDKEYRQRLGTNARRRVETHYTWKANAGKVRKLCLEAMGKHA